MVEIDVVYEGGLHCRATHGPSRATLETDAPVDNHGKGEAFSPTDLLATALGSCMLTLIGIVAGNHGWNVDGMRLHVQKQMSADRPRRVARLGVDFEVPAAVSAALDADARAKLEHAANTCPVRLSIHAGIEVPVVFHW
jgi:putative redox protein